MLGGPGAGVNYGFWSRFVMVEGVGVWAMELLHGLTGMLDLYTHLVPHDLGGFAVTIQNPTAPVEVPDLFEDTATLATNKLHGVGLLPHFEGSSAGNARVSSQHPAAGELVLRGRR